MRIAFMADIHGNLPALEAAVADLSTQSPDAVYLVGDQINRCPWSNEVLDLIADRGWPAIYGNHELVLRMLAEPHEPSRFDDRNRFPDLWWTMERLGARRLATISDYPAARRLGFGYGHPIHLVHGVPGDPFRGFYFESSDSDLLADLSGVSEDVLVCAHTHQPLYRTIGRKKILNGGSVGIPYNGDPRAQYLVLTLVGDCWIPKYRRVEYDVSAVREGFREKKLSDALGPLAEINLRTIETAQPWTSDFAHWLNRQSRELHSNLERALEIYELTHGPGQWSFLQENHS